VTALFIAQIGDFDFADYVRVGPGDGLDPYGQGWQTPQFADAAFGDGQPLSNVSVGNREMVWPLYLNRNFLLPGDNLTPEEELLMAQHIHELVVDMNRALAQPNLQLQWCDSHAQAITYYDVAFARFDPEYNHRQDQFGWKAGTLRVWCSPPWGHTGTYRVVATAAGGSAAARIPIASNLSGDTDAALQVSVRRGGAEPLTVPGRSIAVAAVPSGIEGLIPAASMVAGDGATFASGMLQYTDSFSGIDSGGRAQVHLSPGSAYAGQRMRVLAVAEPNSRSGLEVSAFRDGLVLGAPQLATAVGARALLDLGAFEVSAVDTRATHTLDLLMHAPVGTLRYGLRSANGVVPGLHSLVVAPDDALTVVCDVRGKVAGFDDTMGASPGRITGRRDAFGNEWSTWLSMYELVAGTYPSGRLDQRGFMATSGAWVGDAAAGKLVHRPLENMTVNVGIQPDSVRTCEFYAYKDLRAPLDVGATDSVFARARLRYNGQGLASAATGFLQLYGEGNGTTMVLGSVALPSLAAISGQPALLQLAQRGEGCEARVYTAGGSCIALCTGAVPGIDRAGYAVVNIYLASGTQDHRILDVEVLDSQASALMSPTDTYIVGSAAYRTHPSVGFSGEVTMLGAAPRLPVDAAAVVVAIGGHEPGDAPSVNAVEVRAQERFGLAR
jgi:hypothetical protein